jgi:thiol:disulfide interchange protein
MYSRTAYSRTALLTAALALALAGCAAPSADAPALMPTSTPSAAVASPAPATPSVEPGSYITLADYEAVKAAYDATDVVLFFNAQWCSTCKVARDNIESDLAGIPSGLTIVVVDFDTATDLRQKYGVTVQHTFVQVDADGNERAKWSGSVTADEIAQNTV